MKQAPEPLSCSSGGGDITDPLLIVANWARPLAQSAHRAGIRTVALDLFADAHTRRYARAAASIASRLDALRIDFAKAASVSRALAADCRALVYGAGFEAEPEQIARIAGERTVFGNNARCVRLVKHPARFFGLLDEIGLPHPETCMQPPRSGEGWLVKHIGDQGGAHVRAFARAAFTAQPQAEGRYFQRYVAGTPCSVLFLADGRRARVIGWNEQLVEAVGDAPYCYGGAIGDIALPPRVHADVRAKLDAVAQRSGLLGLNSLDFILQDEAYFVLEINPRPSATMDLYDADCPGGLLAWHIEACRGNLSDAPLAAHAPRGHAVLYARRDAIVPDDFDWPAWCSDTEAPGTTLPMGAPVCMVHAQDADARAVNALLAQRVRVLRAALMC
jgi:uncharacterized protein